jgi:hypothetical protein
MYINKSIIRFYKYSFHGKKKFILDILFFIRELKKDNHHLMQVGQHREWR